MESTGPTDDTRTQEPTTLERLHRELFHKAGVTGEQIQVIKDWNKRLNDTAEALAREERLMAPHEQAAREVRREALTAKRHSPGGLSPVEDTELRDIYRQLVAERQRSEG